MRQKETELKNEQNKIRFHFNIRCTMYIARTK